MCGHTHACANLGEEPGPDPVVAIKEANKAKEAGWAANWVGKNTGGPFRISVLIELLRTDSRTNPGGEAAGLRGADREHEERL